MASNRQPWHLALLFTIDPIVAQIVRKTVRSIARTNGAGDSESRDIELAVGEVLANIHYHAYSKNPGKATVTLDMEADVLRILIENEGSGIYPDLTIPTTLPAAGGGRGLYVISQLMDTVEILRRTDHGPGTAVRMTKHVARH